VLLKGEEEREEGGREFLRVGLCAFVDLSDTLEDGEVSMERMTQRKGASEGGLSSFADVFERMERHIEDEWIGEGFFERGEEELVYIVALFFRLGREGGRLCPEAHRFEDIAQSLGCVEASPAGRVKARKEASEEVLALHHLQQSGEGRGGMASHPADDTSGRNSDTAISVGEHLAQERDRLAGKDAHLFELVERFVACFLGVALLCATKQSRERIFGV
jgi:hypothetical protein